MQSLIVVAQHKQSHSLELEVLQDPICNRHNNSVKLFLASEEQSSKMGTIAF